MPAVQLHELPTDEALLAALLEMTEEEEEERALVRKAPDSRLFAERHFPVLKRELQGGNGQRLIDHMRKVVSSDRVIGVLELTYPGDQVYFGNDEGDSDRTPVYQLSGQRYDELRATLKACPAVDPSWELLNDPDNWLMTMVMQWVAENRREPDQRMALMFFVAHIYASLVYKYWQRKGGIRKNAMIYAMNNLSDKFILKQVGTMANALMTVAWRSHEFYLPDLKEGSDEGLKKYYVNLRLRLNALVKGLWLQYMEALKSGAYLNQGRDRHDDGEMVDRDPLSGRAQAVAGRSLEAFVGEPTDRRLTGLAARMAGAPEQSVLLALNEIRGGDVDAVREIVGLVLELFFEERRATEVDVKTRSFVAFAASLYARSNTVDGRVERVKSILDELLKRHSIAYLRTNREATKGALRKAFYFYLTLQIQSKA